MIATTVLLFVYRCCLGKPTSISLLYWFHISWSSWAIASARCLTVLLPKLRVGGCHTLRLRDKRPKAGFWKHSVLKEGTKQYGYPGVSCLRESGWETLAQLWEASLLEAAQCIKVWIKMRSCKTGWFIGNPLRWKKNPWQQWFPWSDDWANTSETPKVALEGQKVGKVFRPHDLLLKQLCEPALEWCARYHWPTDLISIRGQNHYSNRLNQFRRKQNQRRLLTPLAIKHGLRKNGVMEGKKEAKPEQHENNRFHSSLSLSLSVIFTPSIDRLLNNVLELSACSSTDSFLEELTDCATDAGAMVELTCRACG